MPVGPVTTTGWDPVGTLLGRVNVTVPGDTPMIVASAPPTVIALVPPSPRPVSETVVGTSRTTVDGEVPVSAGRRSMTSTPVVTTYAVSPSGDTASGLAMLEGVTGMVAMAACCPTRKTDSSLLVRPSTSPPWEGFHAVCTVNGVEG